MRKREDNYVETHPDDANAHSCSVMNQESVEGISVPSGGPNTASSRSMYPGRSILLQYDATKADRFPLQQYIKLANLRCSWKDVKNSEESN